MDDETRRVTALVWALADRQLTTTETAELEAALETPRGRSIYIQFMDLTAQLRWQHSADWQEKALARLSQGLSPGLPTPGIAAATPTSGADSPASASTTFSDTAPQIEAAALSRAPSPLLGFLGTAVHLSATWLSSPKVLAIAVFDGLATYFVGLMISIAIARAYWGQRNPNDQTAASAGAAARIIAASGCRWQDRALPVDLGGRLPAGMSRLTEGVVELEFDGGARVRIDGPAEFVARSGQRMELTRGRLVAYVPKPARGFTIDTPSAQVIDLGTEFGVEVDGQGATDLHVIRGQVEVKAASKPRDGQRQGVVTGGTVRVSAGEAVRVLAGSAAPQRVAPEHTRFDTVRSSTAAEDRTFPADQSIWLGNLFDDDKTLDNSLVRAMQSDAFKASPVIGNSLGVERFTYGGDPVTQIAPKLWFDCANLGWGDGHPDYHRIANDAVSGTGGGIRLKGEPMKTGGPRLEEGIGMHANALITFDLDEIRAAGDLKGRSLRFVCDPIGINDDAPVDLYPGTGSVHMVVLVSGDKTIQSALVDGALGELSQIDGVWRLASVPQEPLHAYGPYVSVDLRLPENARFLTLLTGSAGDGVVCDHGVWMGARLEVVR